MVMEESLEAETSVENRETVGPHIVQEMIVT
jgi:hypothetical protein